MNKHLKIVQSIISYNNKPVFKKYLSYKNLWSFSAWLNWNNWSSCTSSCGGGTRTRRRICSNRRRNDCTGSDEESEVCQTSPCPGKRHSACIVRKVLIEAVMRFSFKPVGYNFVIRFLKSKWRHNRIL